eukprot:gnl/Chilomastix_cuspidata/625.p1 GENE.gnl/Chilomastix_cuspidata/625~~gnl/Chilomastix_cuspidata/625.p1  ORF type:complete len:1073 (-),score=419.93 gnl/Chilomastix_cuspidata/625:3984-6929(-)
MMKSYYESLRKLSSNKCFTKDEAFLLRRARRLLYKFFNLYESVRTYEQKTLNPLLLTAPSAMSVSSQCDSDAARPISLSYPMITSSSFIIEEANPTDDDISVKCSVCCRLVPLQEIDSHTCVPPSTLVTASGDLDFVILPFRRRLVILERWGQHLETRGALEALAKFLPVLDTPRAPAGAAALTEESAPSTANSEDSFDRAARGDVCALPGALPPALCVKDADTDFNFEIRNPFSRTIRRGVDFQLCEPGGTNVQRLLFLIRLEGEIVECFLAIARNSALVGPDDLENMYKFCLIVTEGLKPFVVPRLKESLFPLKESDRRPIFFSANGMPVSSPYIHHSTFELCQRVHAAIEKVRRQPRDSPPSGSGSPFVSALSQAIEAQRRIRLTDSEASVVFKCPRTKFVKKLLEERAHALLQHTASGRFGQRMSSATWSDAPSEFLDLPPFETVLHGGSPLKTKPSEDEFSMSLSSISHDYLQEFSESASRSSDVARAPNSQRALETPVIRTTRPYACLTRTDGSGCTSPINFSRELQISAGDSDTPTQKDSKTAGDLLATLPKLSLHRRPQAVTREFKKRIRDSQLIPRIQDFELIGKISEGAYGQVFKVRFIPTRDIFALKTLAKTELVRKNSVSRAHLEREIMLRMQNEYIVQFFCSFSSAMHLFMVLEYLPAGDLQSLLDIVGCFPPVFIQQFSCDVIKALEYIHSIGVTHRDLKPSNILIAKDGALKLVDFGLSHIGLLSKLKKENAGTARCTKHEKNVAPIAKSVFSHAQMATQSPPTGTTPIVSSSLLGDKSSAGSIKKSEGSISVVGTPGYIAPEILRGEPMDYVSDWFSLGTMIYEFALGVNPFAEPSVDQTFKNILYETPPYLEELEPDLRDLITGLLEKDPHKRVGFNGAHEIRQHPFFADWDWNPDNAHRWRPPPVQRHEDAEAGSPDWWRHFSIHASPRSSTTLAQAFPSSYRFSVASAAWAEQMRGLADEVE